MSKVFVVLATGAAVMATPAMARNADTAFTGPRVGVLLGYDVSKAGSSVDDDVNSDNNESADGFAYGIEAGYDYDLGSVVVGAEASLTDSTAKSKFIDGGFEGFGVGKLKTNRDIYVGGRVGVKAAPTTLVYGKAGYTNAKFDIDGNDGTYAYKEDVDADGYRVGAGVEQLVGQNAYVKLEYDYSNYSKAEIDFEGQIPDSDRFNVDTDRHQVMVGAGIRF